MLTMGARHRINVAVLRNFLVAAALLVVAACGGSSSTQVKAPDYVSRSVRTLAIAPADDLITRDENQLATLVGAELARLGYTVIDAGAAVKVLTSNNVASVDVYSPAGLAALAKDGVDGILSVTATASRIGGPERRHVTARVISTRTGKQVGEVEWHNSWGGMPGSLADYTMRKGQGESAKEVATALAKLLG